MSRSALNIPVPEIIRQRDRWEECPRDELLESPWRHALGVWWTPIESTYSTHPHGWRWTLHGAGSERGGLFVTNDRLELVGNPLRDLEAAHVFAAVELERLDQLGLARVLRRRQQSGTHIGWAEVSGGLVGAEHEARATGRRARLSEVLAALGLTLARVEVRP